MFVEEYQSDQAFESHMGSKQVTGAISEVVPFLASPPDIRRYRRLK